MCCVWLRIRVLRLCSLCLDWLDVMRRLELIRVKFCGLCSDGWGGAAMMQWGG